MPRLRLFLCGDVMTGRGIDQILPHPSAPKLYESYLDDARDYVLLAERKNGPIARPVDFSYVWGDALEELRRFSPHARIVNLETSVTSQRRALAPEGDQLPDASAQRAVPDGGGDRCVRPREQPCPRLGTRRGSSTRSTRCTAQE